MRTVVAFFVAPLVVAVGFSSSLLFESGAFVERVISYLVWVAVVYVYAAISAAVLAVPLFFLLKRLRLVHAWTSVLSGVAITSLAALLLPTLKVWQIVLLCFLGALAGMTFWVIARGELRPNTSLERTREG